MCKWERDIVPLLYVAVLNDIVVVHDLAYLAVPPNTQAGAAESRRRRGRVGELLNTVERGRVGSLYRVRRVPSSTQQV